MADASTVHLSEPHSPKPASLEAFHSTLHEIKNEFHKSRAKWDSHEPNMFRRCHGHGDHELLEPIDLNKDLVQVRTAESAYLPRPNRSYPLPPRCYPFFCRGLHKGLLDVAYDRYGLHLFGKIKLGKVEDAFIHVRLFVTGEGAKVHSIQTEEKEEDGGKKSFNAIFREKDSLERFNE